MNPRELVLNPSYVEPLHPSDEIALLSTPVDSWEPVLVLGRLVLEGRERVLTARKHGFNYIPVVEMKCTQLA